MFTVRVAVPEDANAILEIYRPYILQTAFTFETQVPSIDDFKLRMEKYLEKYPWLIADFHGQVAAYVYGSIHREREAYQWTCECSVYVHENFKGRGLGLELYAALFEILKRQGFRNVYAGITKPNEPSENLHRKSGFEQFAVYENIGYKFNQWHNVGWWRLAINSYDRNPAPPINFKKMSPEVYEGLLKLTAQKINLNQEARE